MFSSIPQSNAEIDLSQDWFHESCLNLRPITDLSKVTKENSDDEDEDEDEENALIPSDTYDGLICANCVKSNHFLREKAGQTGFMIIEPTTDGWEVLGRSTPKEEQEPVETAAATNGSDDPKDEMGKGQENGNDPKREPDELAEERPLKKARLDLEMYPSTTADVILKGKGDIFLADGIREELKASLSVRLQMKKNPCS